MRGLLALVFVTGFVATLVALAASYSTRPTDSQSPQVASISEAGSTDRIAELKAQNSPQFTTQEGVVELQRSSDGHFYADVRINGSPVHMLVDTGASAIALSRDDARSAGIATSIGMNDVVGEGADGAVHGEFARLDKVELGPLSAEGLEAVVVNSGQQSLLGQSFLSRFKKIEISGDRMLLQ